MENRRKLGVGGRIRILNISDKNIAFSKVYCHGFSPQKGLFVAHFFPLPDPLQMHILSTIALEGDPNHVRIILDNHIWTSLLPICSKAIMLVFGDLQVEVQKSPGELMDN